MSTIDIQTSDKNCTLRVAAVSIPDNVTKYIYSSNAEELVNAINFIAKCSMEELETFTPTPEMESSWTNLYKEFSEAGKHWKSLFTRYVIKNGKAP